MALQKVHVAIILRWVLVVARDASSRVGVLLGFLPISLHNLFCAYGDGFRS
jgi:hypothetical protein